MHFLYQCYNLSVLFSPFLLIFIDIQQRLCYNNKQRKGSVEPRRGNAASRKYGRILYFPPFAGSVSVPASIFPGDGNRTDAPTGQGVEMSDKKKHYRWRAYLDDFQMDATGQYIYTGKRYAFAGDDRARRIYFIRMILCGLLLAAATVLPECLPPTAISRTPITLVPWGLQLIAVFLTCWSLCRIFAHASELRAYVYRATVGSLPGKSLVAASLSAITFVCHIVYFPVKDVTPDAPTILRTVCPAVSAVAGFLLFLTVRAGKWEEKI